MSQNCYYFQRYNYIEKSKSRNYQNKKVQQGCQKQNQYTNFIAKLYTSNNQLDNSIEKKDSICSINKSQKEPKDKSSKSYAKHL